MFRGAILPMGPFNISAAPLIGGASAVFATGAVAWGAIASRSQLFGHTIRHTGDSRTIALTFDDGPNPALTPNLLRVLEVNHVHATFFLIGSFVKKCPGVAQEIAACGHTIGNHTHTHRPLFWISRGQAADEIARCQDAIEETCGRRPMWMRPPFGIRGPHISSVVRQAGLKGVVMWSRSARDWKPRSVADTVQRLSHVRGGEIVLLHDGDCRRFPGDRHLTLAGLDYWLPMWKSAGLEFVTLDDIARHETPDT
ncbi:MAG TPA: polysaccharide deacetylase family protein [Candidatus Acidoferrales bacterium]|nr:polysaccharide deacetylase family protein [Candidatus Acidoferrales bacterium]